MLWHTFTAHHVVRLEVAGRRVQAVVNATAHRVEVVVEGQRFVFERPDPFAGAGAAAGEGSLTAPMPGTVVSVAVEKGAEVAAGDVVLVLEAMKMQHTVTAPAAGTVTEIDVQPGAQVAAGEVLAVVSTNSTTDKGEDE